MIGGVKDTVKKFSDLNMSNKNHRLVAPQAKMKSMHNVLAFKNKVNLVELG